MGVASTLAVALTAGTVTYFAMSSRGETVHETDLDDGGVWVSSSKDGRFARVNKAVGQFDGGVASSSGPGDPLDVVQDDNAVAGLVTDSGSLTPVEPRTGRLDSAAAVAVPAPAVATNLQVFAPQTVDLRGGTVATVEPRTGKVWAQTYDPDQGLTTMAGLATGAKPVATAGAGAAMAVDVRGGIHVVSGATGTVVSVPRTSTGFGPPVSEKVPLRDAKAVDITVVGTRWVVYDPMHDRLYAQGSGDLGEGGVAREAGHPAYAALQQPGPAASTVGLEDTTTLHLVALDDASGGDAVQVVLGEKETPPLVSRPLRTGSCVHAAWGGTTVAYYGKACGSPDAPQPAVTIERSAPTVVKDGVALRSNHGLVVLNDLDGGEVWDLDTKPKKLDEWDSLVPPPRRDDKTKKKDENLIDEASVAQPPKAQPDELRARPGRTSKLHVLDNDTDAAGSVLAIDPGDVGRPDLDGVSASVAADGQSIDVGIPTNPGARTFSFTYKVNNGRAAQKSQAKVTVTIVGDEENDAPTLRPGTATLTSTVYPVNVGKLLPVQVLGDWRDRQNDPVSVQAVAEGSSVDGLGRLTLMGPSRPGNSRLEYAVTDGRAVTTSTVTVRALGLDDSAVRPRTQPDVVRGVVGKPLQVEPLGNDVPGADPAEPDARLRLSRQLASRGGLLVDTNLDTGVLTLTGSSPGTFDLSYGAQVGGAITAGRIRVDLVADPDPTAPPVAVPDTASLRDQTPVLTDVLANDYSPRADVLVTRSVSVDSADSWLRPSIYQGRWVRIEALDPATPGARPRQGKVRYTISDGSRTATGEVAVSQFPADDRAVPIVQDDVAVVRSQDTVTIPVMDNDSMADGIPLVLDPASVKVLDGRQSAYASGNVVRYVPEDTNPRARVTRTIEYAVYPLGAKAKAQTGRIAVTVTPQPTTALPNQAPVARSFSTSVTAGDPLTITIPSSGVDPDGDSVTVTGLVDTGSATADLALGRVTSFGPSTIRYEAYPGSAGTEVLHYEVRDRFGATSRGFVRIGVVQPGDPQPPVAVDDEVRAAPGKRVTVDVTQNDLVARGDTIEVQYKPPVNGAEDLARWRVDESTTTFSTTVPGVREGVRHLTYGISNGLFDPSRAAVSVVPVPGFVNPPTAVDDTAKPGPGETSTVVDVLANDRDVDGPRESLRVSQVLSPDAAVEANRVRVQVKPYAYAVPYVITDEDGASAMALVQVPPGQNGVPYVVPGAVIEVDVDGTRSVALSDYVRSPRGRSVRITTADALSASPRGSLSVTPDGRTGITLRASGGYRGPAAVLLEVSDQETVQQKDFGTAYVSIPVQVGPKVPLLRCPAAGVRLNAGGLARTVDLPTVCHAWVPVGSTLDDFRFRAAWRKDPTGVDLDQRGTGGRVVQLRAHDDAPGADAQLVVGAEGGPESVLGVTVVGRDDLAQVGSGGSSSLERPRVRPFTISGLEAGSAATVDLRAYLDSPLDKPECALVASSAPAGSGLSVSRNACSLTVSASSGARGTSFVSVTVSDGPGRSAQGRGRVEILGKPTAPRMVAAEADRVTGGTARVRWLPPSDNGGSPVTRYDVGVVGGPTKACSASPCTITGLENGKPYRFTVTAVNAVGSSPAAGPTAAVVPDTLPNPPTGTRMASRGDGTLTIAWSAPAPKGSAVRTYQVRATDTSTGGVREQVVDASVLQATLSGLQNNDAQSVQVRARNDLGYGPFSAAVQMQSAGTPPPVPAPRIANAGAGPADDSARLTVSWDPVSPNGPALVRYTVYRSVNGSAFGVIGQTAPDNRAFGDTIPYDGNNYDYVVTATNGAGNESGPANPSRFSSVGTPSDPGRPSVSTPTDDKKAIVQVVVGTPRSGGFQQLQWLSTTGASGAIGCGCPAGGSVQFVLEGLGVDQQQLQVRTFNGVNWSQWGPPSNAFQPYGPTKRPDPLVGDRVGSNDARWTWEFPFNGREVDQFDIQFNTRDGGDWGGDIAILTSPPPTSFRENNLRPGGYAIRIRAHSKGNHDPNSDAWSAWTDWVWVTIPGSQ